jgi:hypothetical protein
LQKKNIELQIKRVDDAGAADSDPRRDTINFSDISEEVEKERA